MTKVERDEISGTNTTGHEWDGIKELDTPLPRWWLWTFIACIIWAFGYMVAYPAIPLPGGATKGMLGYSTRASVADAIAEVKKSQARFLDRIEKLPLAEIAKDDDLLRFAIAGGRSAFAVNCSQCHGSGAAGAPGYPNLNDDDWLWGGKLGDIYQTIQHGIRFERDEDTRTSEMPAFGADDILERAQIKDVAQYVLSLSGSDHDAAAAGRGKPLFEENCAACHKPDGSGDREQGAPRLNDALWLYGDEAKAIEHQVTRPSHGIMPAWSHRLKGATIKQLALFVHSLGGGE